MLSKNQKTTKKDDLPILPPEIIEDILLLNGDVKPINAFGMFWLMKRFLPKKLVDVVGKDYIRLIRNKNEWYDGEDSDEEEWNSGEFVSEPATLVDWAAATGRLRYLKYLTENTDLVGTTHALDSAAFYGHSEIVKYLHHNRTEGCTYIAMDLSAMRGKLDIVEFLHQNRTEGCSILAIDYAATNGHLDIVKFLHEHRDEGCTTKAIDFAAAPGHFEVVKFLLENRTEGCTSDAVMWAICNDHYRVAISIFPPILQMSHKLE